ncbi:MAG: TetR/AcrR family transcriptional regulator [Halanaerobium sp.]
MPPKKKYSRKQIIDQAFELAKKEGIENITIRKVAKKLNSSAAPIYQNFDDAEDLINEIIKRTFKLGKKLIEEANSGEKFKDIGLASLHFAQQYPLLFRDLIMNQGNYMSNYDQDFGNSLVKEMQKDSNLNGLNESELKLILLKMRVVHTGLAVMVANGLLSDKFTAQEEEELLDSLAADIIKAAKIKKNKV